MPNFTGRIARGVIDHLNAVSGMGFIVDYFVFLARRKPARIGP
jgi:hypothetical protein